MVALLAGLSLLAGCGAPSDDVMINGFQTHRAQYSELLSMFQSDRQLHFIGQWNVPEAQDSAIGTLDHARVARYRTLMDQLHVDSVERYFGHTILVVTSTGGLAPSGFVKGYLFAKKPPSPLVGDTANTGDSEGEVYRHIEGDWYLMYEWN